MAPHLTLEGQMHTETLARVLQRIWAARELDAHAKLVLIYLTDLRLYQPWVHVRDAARALSLRPSRVSPPCICSMRRGSYGWAWRTATSDSGLASTGTGWGVWKYEGWQRFRAPAGEPQKGGMSYEGGQLHFTRAERGVNSRGRNK